MSKLRDMGGGRVEFKCPGCDDTHVVAVSSDTGAHWGFNGNNDAPTFTPSVLVTSGHYLHGNVPGNCYCDVKERIPSWDGHWKCTICHSFVTDGNIQFLGDCTHSLAGQTVPLPDCE